jgi:hypothetical protein
VISMLYVGLNIAVFKEKLLVFFVLHVAVEWRSEVLFFIAFLLLVI